MLKSKGLTDTPAWSALQAHHCKIKDLHLKQLFGEDAGRGERFTAEGADLHLDFSKNRVTDETLQLLVQLARERGVAERRDAMFRGEAINVTEKRAVLHVALRERIIAELSDTAPVLAHDGSTNSLIRRYRALGGAS